jgi:tetratricopeptide (TPR) repeat protein
MSQIRKDILNGWKDIATYVGRDIRTVERWEKQRGLPIRRVPGEGRATVYAVVSELDRWFANADAEERVKLSDETVPVSVTDNQTNTLPNADVHLGPIALASEEEQTSVILSEEYEKKSKAIWGGSLAAALILAVAGSAGWSVIHHQRSHVAGKSATPVDRAVLGSVPYSFDASLRTPGVPYPSKVGGVDEVYLRGVYFYEQRRPETLKRAVECFSEAIAKDPNYAPAYAGLSNTYNLQREYSTLSDEIAYPKAKEAAQRAIELDPKLPQAHVSMGFINFFWSADPVAAEREFRRAIDLDPSLVTAHHWYGSVLTQEGRYPEAMVQLNLAQRLDPTSAAVFSTRALALGMSGHRGEAVDMLQELLNEVPEAPPPHQMLQILSLVEPHDIPRWISESRFTATMRNDKGRLKELDIAEPAFRSGGEKAMWSALLKEEERQHPAPGPPTDMMGIYQALLGNNDAAFAILMANEKHHSRDLIVMNMDPRLALLRSDPRYAQMFAETHIAEAMNIH